MTKQDCRASISSAAGADGVRDVGRARARGAAKRRVFRNFMVEGDVCERECWCVCERGPMDWAMVTKRKVELEIATVYHSGTPSSLFIYTIHGDLQNNAVSPNTYPHYHAHIHATVPSEPPVQQILSQTARNIPALTARQPNPSYFPEAVFLLRTTINTPYDFPPVTPNSHLSRHSLLRIKH